MTEEISGVTQNFTIWRDSMSYLFIAATRIGNSDIDKMTKKIFGEKKAEKSLIKSFIVELSSIKHKIQLFLAFFLRKHPWQIGLTLGMHQILNVPILNVPKYVEIVQIKISSLLTFTTNNPLSISCSNDFSPCFQIFR